MENKIKKLKATLDFGGIDLLLFKLEDKLNGKNSAADYKYKIMENAAVEDYPRLLGDIYTMSTGCPLNIKTPTTFNEKIQWLKLYDSTPIKTRLADKYLVREWISDKIGSDYLVPIIGVWDSFEEIDFASLPDKFVLKCNHGSGMNLVITGKNELDPNHAKNQFDKWMHQNFAYMFGFEMHYKDIVPKIIAEKFIEEISGGLNDYKFHCFNGKVEFIQCIGDRDFEKHTGYQKNYDIEWNELPWTFEDYPRFPYNVTKPACLDEMIRIAEILSNEFSYVRVDLYEISGKVLFGEMTFTPGTGFYPYRGTFTHDIDLYLGEKISLPN